jgi:hypothetical protein
MGLVIDDIDADMVEQLATGPIEHVHSLSVVFTGSDALPYRKLRATFGKASVSRCYVKDLVAGVIRERILGLKKLPAYVAMCAK